MFELVDPNLVTNYDEVALNVIKERACAIKYVNPEFVNNYDELVIKAMEYNYLNIEDVAQEDVLNLEDTKREALIKDLKSFKCRKHYINRIVKTIFGPCSVVKNWPKDYKAFKKKQEGI